MSLRRKVGRRSPIAAAIPAIPTPIMMILTMLGVDQIKLNLSPFRAAIELLQCIE